MKVAIQDFKSALALFEAELIGTMKTSLHKFLAGAALAASGNKIDEMIRPFVGEDGLVDVDALKNLADAGLKQCGGEFEIPISFGVLGAFGATPIKTRLSKIDFDKFFTQTLPAVARSTAAG